MGVDDVEPLPIDPVPVRTGPPRPAVVVMDPHGVIRSWNDRATELLGYAADVALGRTVAELLVPPVVRQRHVEGVQRWRDEGARRMFGGTYNLPVVVASGEHVLLQLSLLELDVGDETWAVALLAEVDATLKTTPDLPQSALEELFDRAPEAITVLDRHGRQRSVNASGSRMLGYPEGGHSPLLGVALVHPDEEARVRQRFRQELERTVPPAEPIRYRVRNGFGSWTWLESVVLNLTDVAEVDGFVAFSRDVTADEERRRELDVARSRLAAAIEGLPGAAVIEDTDGCITHHNAQFGSLAGPVIGSFVGHELQPFLDRFVDSVIEEPELAGRIRAAQESDLQLTADALRLTGGRVVRLESVPIGSVPERLGRLWILRDVTEQHETQRHLIESLEREADARRVAEQAMQELQLLADSRLAFVSAVSHELRTPLTSVVAAVEHLMSGGRASDDELGRYLPLIARNALRLVRLVDDLLLVGRLSAGQLDSRHDEVDVPRVVLESVDDQRTAASRRSIEIVVTVSEGPALLSDEHQLRQILDNLVANAVKYADEGSVVDVMASFASSAWTLVVENHGPGIAPADRERVFEPFFRATRTAAATPGTGLGLSIVRGLAELHGGTVVLDPDFAAGARFVVTLPADGGAAG